MVNFPRNATHHLQSLFAAFPVVVVTGARQVGGHPLFGALFETAMVCEIRKTLALMGGSANLYHWRASTGAEVDCIIERDGWLHPIEIKLTAQPTCKRQRGIT